MARTNVGAAAKTSPRRVRTTEQTIKALDLRKKGHTYTEIARKLECARSTACRYVLSELENLADQCREEAGQVRDLELARLDELYLKAWEAVEDGNIAAIDRCLRVQERRAKLLGLDAAEKVDLSGDIVIVDDIARRNAEETTE